MSALPPGSTIGIIGSGQLGRMLAIAAAQLGFRTHIYAPETGPGCDVSNAYSWGAYADRQALAAFAAKVDVVTFEFENVAAEPLAAIAATQRVLPNPRALAVAQDRAEEKRFAEAHGGRPAPWRAVANRSELDAAIAALGTPAILKTRRFGYDGKGQARIATPDDAGAAWDSVRGHAAVLEAMVAFEHEFSIILARAADGTTVSYAAPRNEHRGGILARSTVPAPADIVAQTGPATALTERIAAALDYVGVMTIEFFAGADGPVFNEMAPRVHNSGHWTIEGAETSQFENHIRAVTGLPLGPTGLTGTAIEMENLIGSDVERAAALFAEPGAHVHLYGKNASRPGRKMGHVTRVWR